jgi:FtsH-binding integral membrane protein
MTKGQIAIAVIVLIGFLAISGSVFFMPERVPDFLEKILNMIVGAWIVLATTVVNWFFGSSKGSSDKTALLTGGRTTPPSPPGV